MVDFASPAPGPPEPDGLGDGEVHLWCCQVAAGDERERRAVSRSLFRLASAAYAGQGVDAVPLEYSARGKPAIRGSAIRPSMSHAGDRLLLGFARGQDIGVDIEQVRGDVDIAALVEPELTPAERTGLDRLADAGRMAAGFRAWTRVEAAAKASGDGFLGSSTARRSHREGLVLVDLRFDGAYVGALAAASNPVAVRAWTFPTAAEAAAFFQSRLPR
jgi:hypothetical protein